MRQGLPSTFSHASLEILVKRESCDFHLFPLFRETCALSNVTTQGRIACDVAGTLQAHLCYKPTVKSVPREELQ